MSVKIETHTKLSVKCDRCKHVEVFEGHAELGPRGEAQLKFSTSGWSKIHHYKSATSMLPTGDESHYRTELCPDCMSSFKIWLTNIAADISARGGESTFR